MDWGANKEHKEEKEENVNKKKSYQVRFPFFSIGRKGQTMDIKNYKDI